MLTIIVGYVVIFRYATSKTGFRA